MIISIIIFTIVFFLMLAAALFLDRKAQEYEKKRKEYERLMNKPLNVIETKVPRVVLTCSRIKDLRFINDYGIDTMKTLLAADIAKELVNFMWFTAYKNVLMNQVTIKAYLALIDEKGLHYDLEEALDAAEKFITPGQQFWR